MDTEVYTKLEEKVHTNMESKIYPNLETMCRLCLKENGGTVCIFNKEKNSDKYAGLSIPMRIMTCATLEVHDSDDFPKKICSECRLQLEKSYYFRKMSQVADAKIRKHLRFIGMGKRSKVFTKNVEEEDDDELEFQDSIDFIKEQEDHQKQIEQFKIDSYINEMKLQNEQDLMKTRENLKATCRKELIPVIREELRTEIRIELEENLRKEVTEQCVSQVKESLRSEVREECRQLEIKNLLDDLQTYLTNKKKLEDPAECTSIPKCNNSLQSICSSEANKDIPTSPKSIRPNPPNPDVTMVVELQNENVRKENVLTENISEDDLNTNDEEGADNNYLIYDVDEDFDEKKKSVEDNEYEDQVMEEAEYEDEYTNSNIITYEKISDENVYTNEESGETTSTTSYRIEDNEEGEIQFLQKSSDDINNVIDENPDPTDEHIMVINLAEGIKNDYVEQIEKVKQKVKAKKQSSTKTKKTPDKKTQPSRVTTTRLSTSQVTYLTKTYVNPLQRSTDIAKIFKCDDCPMVFSTKPSLERHLRTHRKLEETGVKYQCPECRIVVSCSSALRRHMYVHCEEKPFSCNVCEKSFVQKEILKRHMQTHTGIKPHQCPHCERSFAQRINLTQHINRTHLEEPRIQQHPCYLCPKRFNHASGLSRHLASHSGVAFQCSECDRTFGDRSSIKRHIINMHGNARSLRGDAKV